MGNQLSSKQAIPHQILGSFGPCRQELLHGRLSLEQQRAEKHFQLDDQLMQDQTNFVQLKKLDEN
jgi:hypothetical protein